MILTGAGQIGMAIARRMGFGVKIVIGDKNINNARSIAEIMNNAGFDCLPIETDLSSYRHAMRALHLKGGRDGNCLHRHSGTAKDVDHRYGLDFLETIC